MTATITCPACKDTHSAPEGDADFLAKNVTRCSICDAHIAYGELVPPCVIEPASFNTAFGERPAFSIRFQDPVTKAELFSYKADPRHAFQIAQAIISMVRP